jgi:hypothetical protein
MTAPKKDGGAALIFHDGVCTTETVLSVAAPLDDDAMSTFSLSEGKSEGKKKIRAWSEKYPHESSDLVKLLWLVQGKHPKRPQDIACPSDTLRDNFSLSL